MSLYVPKALTILLTTLFVCCAFTLTGCEAVTWLGTTTPPPPAEEEEAGGVGLSAENLLPPPSGPEFNPGEQEEEEEGAADWHLAPMDPDDEADDVAYRASVLRRETVAAIPSPLTTPPPRIVVTPPPS